MVKYHTQEKSPTQICIVCSRVAQQRRTSLPSIWSWNEVHSVEMRRRMFLMWIGFVVCARSTIQTRGVDEYMHRPDTRWCIVCGCVRAADTNPWAQNISVELVLQSHIRIWVASWVLAIRCTNAKRIYYASFVLNAVGFLPQTESDKTENKTSLSMCECRRRLATIDAIAFVVCVQLIHGVRIWFVRHSHT